MLTFTFDGEELPTLYEALLDRRRMLRNLMKNQNDNRFNKFELDKLESLIEKIDRKVTGNVTD